LPIGHDRSGMAGFKSAVLLTEADFPIAVDSATIVAE